MVNRDQIVEHEIVCLLSVSQWSCSAKSRQNSPHSRPCHRFHLMYRHTHTVWCHVSTYHAWSQKLTKDDDVDDMALYFFLLTYCQIFDFTHSICFKQLPVLITWNMYNDLCDAFELFSPNLQVQYPQTISRIQKVTCSPPPTYTHFLFSHPSFPAKPNLSVSFPLPLHKPYLSLYTLLL